MSVMGCKYIFIDHLSIIVSDQSGDERKQLDEISTKLKTLTMELNIAVFCVIHTNRQGEARGSAGPEKVANIHIALYREKDDPDPWRRNVLKLSIVKNRFSGRTGPCLWLFYDEITGRLVELDEEAIQKYEEGLSINDSDMPF
jgi:replicative DNA helicase